MYTLPPLEILAVIESSDSKESHYYATVFLKKIGGSNDEEWELLYSLFNLHEKLEDPNQPYGPMFTNGTKRSFLPEDLDSDQIDWLKSLLEKISDPEFSARICDVAWLRNRDRAAAKVAVTHYMNAGLNLEDLEHWTTSVARYSRAYRLATQLGRKSDTRNDVLDFLIERVRAHNGHDPRWFSLKIMMLLYEARFGDHEELIGFSKKIAAQAGQQGDFRRQRDYLDHIAKLHHRDGNKENADAVRSEAAKSFKFEAEQAEAKGGGMHAHHHWEQAIKAFRQVPSLKDQIPRLQKKLADAGQATLDGMTQHTHTTDISDLVKLIENDFSGEASDTVFYKFVRFGISDPKQLRKDAEEVTHGFIASMFDSRFFDYEGRTVSVVPGAFSSTDPGYNERIKADVQRNLSMHRNFCVQAQILLALRTIKTEHIIDIEFLKDFLSDSQFIPEGRLEHYAEGLEYGFNGRFDMACLILTPQFESGLRKISELSGVTPRTMLASGVEDAWGLDRLLAEAHMISLLGENLVFDLRSVLIDDYGPKFRHNLAHGLVPPQVLNGPDAVYVWWLFLRICVLSTNGSLNFSKG